MPRLRDQRTNSAFPVRSLSKDAPDPRTSHSPGGLRTLGAALLLTATRADAQIDCRAPLERQDSVGSPGFAPIRQTLIAVEDIIRRNAACEAAPEPVRMRTTIAAGPSQTGGARIFVRAGAARARHPQGALGRSVLPDPGRARAEYALVNLKPGTGDQAMALKPDPAFPDFTDPFRPQVILVNFRSKSDPANSSPRTLWLRRAKETFDFTAIARLLR